MAGNLLLYRLEILVVCLAKGYLYYMVWRYFLHPRKRKGDSPVFGTVNFRCRNGSKIYLIIYIWFFLGFMEIFLLFIINLTLDGHTIYFFHQAEKLFSAVIITRLLFFLHLLFLMKKLEKNKNSLFFQGQESGREELRQQIHNVTNYMKIIYILACQEKYSEIMEVTKQWSDTVEELVSDNYCSLEYINIVLNGKKREAHKENVKFHAYAEPGFSLGSVRELDAVGILCNLLDNAIEAAPKDGRGYINVTLFRGHEGKKAILKVENNFRQEPVERQGIFLTGKTDKNHHGFGTRYVRNKAEEYGGWSLFSVESGCFTAIVMIPLK